MIIGSHVSMSAPGYLLGAMQETVGYHANACMIYTGAPQNTRRVPVEKLRLQEARDYMRTHGLSMDHVIVHAPYIINLANTIKPETFDLGVRFLRQELERVQALGVRVLVLHPGAHLKEGEEKGLAKIVEGLDLAMEGMGEQLTIALETMAGKGSELGWKFEQLRWIIDHARYGERLGVCMDTCHMHDAGYDVQDLDGLLAEFDRVIGIQRIAAVHVNDSRNVRGARKDRHANIGFGEIGFDALSAFVHHPALADIVKILETPYVEGHAPYGEEIAMLRQNTFDPSLMDQIRRN